MANVIDTSTGQKPDYLLKVEAEQGRLRQKQVKLRQELADGKLTEEEFARRSFRVLEREAVVETVVKALIIRWVTFEKDDGD
jgi:hypothetical protein